MDKLSGTILLSAVMLTACSAPAYKSSDEANTARISFTSLNDQFPGLELQLRGKTYSIDREQIRLASNEPVEKKVFKVPADEQIQLVYKATVFGDISVHPILEINRTLSFEQEQQVNFCTTDLSFTPEQNKNYIAHLEQADGIVCRISLMEIIGSVDERHDHYKQSKLSRPSS